MKKLEKLQNRYNEVEAVVYNDNEVEEETLFDLCEELETLAHAINVEKDRLLNQRLNAIRKQA